MVRLLTKYPHQQFMEQRTPNESAWPVIDMQSVSWEEPVVSGSGPCPRSGHTFTSCGGRFFLFGGTGRLDGKLQTLLLQVA